MRDKPEGALRRGWTTGACATAATAAAYGALVTGDFADPVTITLPKGEQPSFPLKTKKIGKGWARASIVKDAGDDPDVTHGAEISVTVRPGRPGAGVIFQAGRGVGRITKPGLPIPPGEPAINPRPRDMMRQAVADLAERLGGPEDVEIEIAVPGGERLAEQTWNPRLGIVGGLSILGTTGIVIPYSCSAWIHSIHRGIDVARATGLGHVAGATGKVSEAAVKARYNLDDGALIDMGDFAGGMLKYLRRHPVRRVTIAGGFAKLAKLADGHLDLHSGRSQVDIAALAEGLGQLGASARIVARAHDAHMAGEVLEIAREADLPLADLVARRARQTALATLAGGIELDVLVVDRSGAIIGEAGG